MLEVRELTKTYNHKPVVNQISFSVHKGDILALLGPAGAGKSTTLKIIAGILEPSSGQIYYQRKNIIEDLNNYKNRVGYVPEQNDLFPHLSAFEYLQFVGRLYLIPDPTLEEKIQIFMEQFNLTNDMHLPVSSYSTGMIKKVLLAAALIHNPDILILDEPLLDLDFNATLILQDLLKRLADNGKKIICGSQVLEVAEKLCTKAVIMNNGILVSNNPTRELRNLLDLPLLETILKKTIHQTDIEKSAETIISIMQT
ncbi:MAG: ABC transporter ATP-binding protein [Candidatus Aminicenantes bacterium]|nr:ABC transporter ATP-binding protein [Candidatus Aminicenantes bacterium]